MKKRMKRLLSFTLIFAMLLSTIAYADNSMRVAVIKDVSGTVKIRKAGGEKLFPAIENAGLVQGDSIITSKSSGAKLIIDSDKEVKIGENTQLVMSELVKSLKNLGDKTTLSLLSGKVLITINKKLVKDAKFEIKTPTAVMGVRGTTLETIVIGNRTFLSVFEGTVNARNTTTDKDTNVGALQLAELTSSADPDKPIEVKSVDIKSLELFELEGLKDNPKLPPDLQNQIKEQYEIKKLEEANKPPAPSLPQAPPPAIIYDQPTGAPLDNGGNPTPGPTNQPPAPTNQPPAPTGTQPPAPTGGAQTGGGRDNGGTQTPTISPTPGVAHVSAVQVDSPLDDEYIGEGNQLQMAVTILPSNATDKTVIWSVFNHDGNATIDANGNLTATQAGEVEVKATSVDGSIVASKIIKIGHSYESVGAPIYNIGNTVHIQACNKALNKDPNVIEQYALTVKSTTDPTGININLVEVSKNSAKFTASVVLFAGDISFGGNISTKNDDEIELKITDAQYTGSPASVLVWAVADKNVGQFRYASSPAEIKTLLDGYAALLPGSNPLGLDVTAYGSLSTTNEKMEVASAMYYSRALFTGLSPIQTSLSAVIAEVPDRIALTTLYKNTHNAGEVLSLMTDSIPPGWKLSFGSFYSDYSTEYQGDIALKICEAKEKYTYSADLQSIVTAYIEMARYEREPWSIDAAITLSTAIKEIKDGDLKAGLDARRNNIALAVTAMGNMDPCNQFDFSVLGNNATLVEYTGKAGEQGFGTSISIPSQVGSFNVKTIGNQCFYNSSNGNKDKYTQITIPVGITKIENEAFKECTALDGITIPSSVTSIGGMAFRGCYKFSYANVTLNSSTISTDESAFQDCFRLQVIGKMIPNQQDGKLFAVQYNQPLYINGVPVDDDDHLVDVKASYLTSGISLNTAVYDATTRTVNFELASAPGATCVVRYASENAVKLTNKVFIGGHHNFQLTSGGKKIEGPQCHMVSSSDYTHLVVAFDMPLYDRDGNACTTGIGFVTSFVGTGVTISNADYNAENNTVSFVLGTPSQTASIGYFTGSNPIMDEAGNECVLYNTINFASGHWSDTP